LWEVKWKLKLFGWVTKQAHNKWLNKFIIVSKGIENTL